MHWISHGVAMGWLWLRLLDPVMVWPLAMPWGGYSTDRQTYRQRNKYRCEGNQSLPDAHARNGQR